jgi:aminopeptidase N
MRSKLSLAISLALGAAVFAAAPAPALADAVPVANAALPTTQLPRNVRPTHYQVAVTPHAETLSFDGHVEIELEILEPTDSIVLNQLDMQFSKVMLSSVGGTKLAPSRLDIDQKGQTASFVFGHALPAGKYTLAMDYTGKIGTQANGLFAIDYTNDAGKQRALFTQFENSDARRFIPSWDEPAYKATFDLEATVPTAQMAVSNLPVAERKDLGNGLAKVRFGTSPKMSTYLLFFALGDFERATDTVGPTEVGVVAQRGSIDQARFALQASKEVLAEYNDYFATPFPLPKLDNVASPGSSQFFSAMENWGAIFTFESSLLLNPAISTEGDKHRIYEIAAHEIAHQWFGNLVTMSWWDDLWLNEGFASWMEARTTARLHPEWKTALGAVGSRDRAMKRDAIASTHPVVQHVETVEQANQAFDAITYSKGQAVITMLEGFVGEDAWREGVRSYMKKHAYGNTVSDDLWREVEAAAGRPVLQIAHQFTLQPGIPLLHVGKAVCSGGKTTIELTQDEFTTDRPDKKPLHWNVPVLAAVNGHAPERAVIDGSAKMTLDGCGPVVVNAGQSGYYRTLYSREGFDSLRRDFAALPAIDQLGLLADTWALGFAGKQPASDLLDLAAALPDDADPQVWGRVAGALGGIDEYYKDDPARRTRFRAFAVPRLQPQLQRLGWTAKAGEPDGDAILRSELISTLAELGDPAVIAEAKRRYAASLAGDKAAVPATLRKTLMGIVATYANAAEWDAMRAAARVEKTAQIKDTYYYLLAATEDKALAKRALELALTDEPGATNTARMISIVSKEFPEMAWDFAMAHKVQVDERVDATSRSVYYPGLAGSSGQEAMVQKVREFALKHLDAGSRRSADTAVATIENKIRVRQEQLPAIDAWLARNGKKTAAR